MQIIEVTPRGYCKGVVRAIELVKNARTTYNGNIYILGMIVHNNYVKQALEEYHIISLDSSEKSKEAYLDELKSGLVIFTAHGTKTSLIEKARAKGLDTLDATCFDVLKTHQVIREQINNNKKILYICKHQHPEALAVLAISDKIFPITCIEDVNNLPLSVNDEVFVTNQTTMSLYETENLKNYIAQIYLQCSAKLEICNATKIRQEAIMNLTSHQVDVLIIVGDAKSNNSNMLVNINDKIEKRYLINSVDDLQIAWFKENDVIAISSGASTPTYLTNQVISYLSKLDLNNNTTYNKPQIDIKKIL